MRTKKKPGPKQRYGARFKNTGFNLETDLLARLNQLARDRDMSASAILRTALREYLCQHAAQPSGDPTT